MILGPNADRIDQGGVPAAEYGAEVVKILFEYLYTDRTPNLTQKRALEVSQVRLRGRLDLQVSRT